MKTKEYIVSILVENEPGALARVIGFYAQRGYNIENLTVAPTEDKTLSRITVTTYGSENINEQIVKQLNRLISVYKVFELSDKPHIKHELVLIKLRATKEADRAEIKRISDIFASKIIDISSDSYVLELVGKSSKIESLLGVLSAFNIIEIARSGICGVARGAKSIANS